MSKRVPIPREVAVELRRVFHTDPQELASFLDEHGFEATARWMRRNPCLLARAFSGGFRVEREKKEGQERNPFQSPPTQDTLKELRSRFSKPKCQSEQAHLPSSMQ